MTNAMYRRWWFWDYAFDRFRWYRRWCGGKWERWWVDVVYCDAWHQVSEFSRVAGIRPCVLCRGTPDEEEHG